MECRDSRRAISKLPDPPGYSAVRALLMTLEGKGLAKHGKDSRCYIYQPAVPEKGAKRFPVESTHRDLLRRSSGVGRVVRKTPPCHEGRNRFVIPVIE